MFLCVAHLGHLQNTEDGAVLRWRFEGAETPDVDDSDDKEGDAEDVVELREITAAHEALEKCASIYLAELFPSDILCCILYRLHVWLEDMMHCAGNQVKIWRMQPCRSSASS